jgi:hypothetical protein
VPDRQGIRPELTGRAGPIVLIRDPIGNFAPDPT